MTRKNFLLLICEADSNIGFGHLSRSLEIYLSFKHSTQHRLLFVPVVQKDVLVDILKSRNIENDEDILNIERWDHKKIINSFSKEKLDLAIIDTHKEHKDLRNHFTEQAIKTISLDYFFKNNPPSVSINLFNHSKSLKYSYSHEPTKIFTGGQFAIIRKEFEALRSQRINFKTKESIEECLIIMGGADPKNKTLDALELIKNNLPIDRLKTVDIVIGHLFKNTLKKKILSSTKGYEDMMKVHSAPNEIARLFKNKDLIFCGGGTTLLESMSVGVPAAVMPQSIQEENHANYYSNKNCCVLIRGNKFPNELNKLDYRSNLSENSMKNIDHKGKYRIVKIVNEILDA